MIPPEAKPNYQQMHALPMRLLLAGLGTTMAMRKEILIDCERVCVGGRSSSGGGRVSLSKCAIEIQRRRYNAASVLLKSSADVGRCERAAFIYSMDAPSLNNLKMIQVIN